MDAERISNAPFAELAAWTAEAGLEGLTEAELLSGFCTRAVADGLPLARAAVIIDTLHPVYEGRVFTWQRDQAEIKVVEYGRSDEGEAGEKWRRSPFYRLVQTGDEMLRQAITPATEAEFPILRDFGAAGMT